MQTYAYGFPRLGKNREFKKVVEGYWQKKVSLEELKKGLGQIQTEMIASYENTVDQFPTAEITAYDPMFDTALLLGLYDVKGLDDIDAYYELCRGQNALEMSKWFNTNYHYLITDFATLGTPPFKLGWNKPKCAREFTKSGIPYYVGPFTFLKLSKGVSPSDFKNYLLQITQVYKEAIQDFKEVHIDEPAFVLELTNEEISFIKEVYGELASAGARISLFTYYDSVDFLKDLFELPVKAIGLDFVHGRGNLEEIKKIGFPKDKTLIAGVVDGRNVWKTDIAKAVSILKELSGQTEQLVVSNAAPLYHLPISLEGETLDQQLLDRLSFAEEKLVEIKTVAEAFESGRAVGPSAKSDFGSNASVQERVGKLTEKDFERSPSYDERHKAQEGIIHTKFPTTTIGSFPQTSEVRRQRASFRAGKISQEEYETYVKSEIEDSIKKQEALGLDVFVHGEFERTDMVEFFAEKLDGIATTKKGWIISYGTRGYRPPIIYGDVSRPEPMTLKEITYAQSLTEKPVKGMLTGPITILAWSFVRDDIPTSEVAYQIGLSLLDEIKDYEAAGIKIAQVDEPAFREKAPIKRKDWEAYFDWAIKAFRLTNASVKPETQIHTHMCYSEFGEIIDKIDAMDFDVISIEASRSKGDIIEHFERIQFNRQIGLGVWDIHSPAIPSVNKMKEVVTRALKVIPEENFWVNPDCGLKTRGWNETEACLKNLTELATALRK